MANEPYFNRGEAVVTLASLGGGAWNSTVGANYGDLLASAESLELTFDGDVSITFPGFTKTDIKDRGATRRRSQGGPVTKHTGTTEGSFTLNASLTSFTSTSAATLIDVLTWATAHTRTGSYVENNWEGSEATSAGSGDDCPHLIGVKYQVTDCGDATDTHFFAFYYLSVDPGWSVTEGEEVSQVSFTATIMDHPDDYLVGPRS